MRNLPAGLPAIPDSTRPLPVEYSAAVAAIAACRTFDEAQSWSDRADAMAAWAKIYANDGIEREARSLKLHAYRRIGLLAAEMRPMEFRGRGGAVGPHSLLRESGFKRSRACDIVKIAKMPQDKFEAVASSARPPSPSSLCALHLRPNPEWAQFSQRMRMFMSAMRQADAKDVAQSLSPKDLDSAFKACREILYWLVPFHDELKRRQCVDADTEASR